MSRWQLYILTYCFASHPYLSGKRPNENLGEQRSEFIGCQPGAAEA
jgi:hypothetical protein